MSDRKLSKNELKVQAIARRPAIGAPNAKASCKVRPFTIMSSDMQNGEGCLDALTFYGVRHPRSQCAWAYWEYCEEEWRQRPPSPYRNFEKWLREAEDCTGSFEKQSHNSCKEELMATNKAVDTLLQVYLSSVEHEGTFVRAFKKAARADTRVKLIGELKNLNKKRWKSWTS